MYQGCYFHKCVTAISYICNAWPHERFGSFCFWRLLFQFAGSVADYEHHQWRFHYGWIQQMQLRYSLPFPLVWPKHSFAIFTSLLLVLCIDTDHLIKFIEDYCNFVQFLLGKAIPLYLSDLVILILYFTIFSLNIFR